MTRTAIRFDDLIETVGIEDIPATEGQTRLARGTYRSFGKGTGLPAQLELGDCFSYALARQIGQPRHRDPAGPGENVLPR